MIKRRTCQLELPSGALTLGQRTLLMGVLNVTPDSFSDGGKFFDVKRAAQHALAMQRDGADIIDIGAESTRPGSVAISAAEESRRLAYSVTGGAATHHNASFQVLAAAEGGTLLVWTTDLLPATAAGSFAAMIEAGSTVIKQTLEGK